MGRILAIAVAACAAAVLIWRPAAPSPPLAVASPLPARHRPAATLPSPAAEAVVYVAGAVRHPGLYRVPRGARADDAVRRSGGFRADADTGSINLAAHVADGDEVYVAVAGAPTPRPSGARRKRTSSARSAKRTATAVVDVNTASEAELATVPGIGATLAARIVAVRERDGAYTSLDELLDVAGMTTARLDRAQPYLQI